MFDNMKQLYEMQKQARALQGQLENLKIEKSSNDGLVKTTVNGLQRIESISIDPSLLSPEKKAALEKTLQTLINETLEQIQKQAAIQAAEMMNGFQGS